MNQFSKSMLLFGAATLLLSCQSGNLPETYHVRTTGDAAWMELQPSEDPVAAAPMKLAIDTTAQAQEIEGFGACFNELGWTSLNELPAAQRNSIMEELFAPEKGACFTVCRMPIGANDFSRQWYSYNEVDADFDMCNFSIENDRTTLIPFIQSALSINPDLKLWASPWCPPSWMKHNRHYASKFNGNNPHVIYHNGMPEDRAGDEGMDMFIMEDAYLKAYALYFRKFIQEYRKEGIEIGGVMPQNEFNSAQVFPSCCWTAKGLSTFIGKYLGPAMEEENVDVLMGTMERGNYRLVDTVLTDPHSGKYIKGVGFQWAGRKAIADIHRMYPDMKLLQTEQECGNGKNDWSGLLHSWNLLKHYLKNGVSVYDYWNISLKKGGISRWGWAQNSLVVVDEDTHTFEYTLEYYLMKHISHFVQQGAHFLLTTGEATDNTLTFLNPDGSVVVLIVEEKGETQQLEIACKGKTYPFTIAPSSINTIVLN